MNEPIHPDRVNQPARPRYMSLNWIGLILLVVVAIRSLIFYRDQPPLPAVILLLAAFAFFYILEPMIAARISRFPIFYFPLQTAILLALSCPSPFLDIIQVLYIPLSLQVMYAFAGRRAMAWLALFTIALNGSLIRAAGWLEGLAFSLPLMSAYAFLLSYERLSARMQRDRDDSQRLLAELQQAHRQLKEYAGRAEELAAAREHNRLARDLHDSVSQSIFAIIFTSQATRLLLNRDPESVPEQLDQLQGMTASALSQLRSLIAQLHPPTTG